MKSNYSQDQYKVIERNVQGKWIKDAFICFSYRHLTRDCTMRQIPTEKTEAANLVGKTITYPTAFGSDTIWIDGHAYYDLLGFGLIKWSGPSKRTEDYTMYEFGVKVGIMVSVGTAVTQTAY